MSDDQKIVIDEIYHGQRLDKVCVALFPDISRERLKQLISNGGISVANMASIKPSMKVEAGQIISFSIPDAVDPDPQPENIPLNIMYEDDDLIVINKQAGLVVHPGAGNWTGTLVNALLHHCADTLSGIGGVRRPGIVHRLDKDTSGLMLVAKNDTAHAHLSAQLSDRSLTRVYEAFVWNVPMPMLGTIDLPVGRDYKNRLKQAVRHGVGNAREAITHYKTLKSYGESSALVECRLETGRTHQIRVHMAAKGYPLLGDPLYGGQPTMQRARIKDLEEFDKNTVLNFPRQALHAKSIAFFHPQTNEKMTFSADFPEDLENLSKILDKMLAFT
jgi:23S rRNA pseudouridine1911/1915/1917 synthase